MMQHVPLSCLKGISIVTFSSIVRSSIPHKLVNFQALEASGKSLEPGGNLKYFGVIPYGNFIGNLTHPYLVGGWFLPLWKIMEFKSVGMMTFSISGKNKIHVQNHQPAM